ncbi:S-adenosyl-L-methionine-dependent methyltransferase [Schizophyllum commune Tattone D]|nr:S-adenosyl-L-methionine-dependent methyltransferase [Schizophyllum commune Tattone D]
MPMFFPGEHAGYDSWAASEAYHAKYLLGEPDAALAFAVENSRKNGLLDIAVSAPQGKYLHLLVRALKAKRVLEIGTLGAYSTIWMARGLPADGKLKTFELNEKTAAVAKENIAHAGLADRVEVVIGPAEKSLAEMKGAEEGSYDFAFIDAFMVNNVTYMKECKRLVESGGVIIVDNIVQNGLVADEARSAALKAAGEETSYIESGRELLQYLQSDPDLEATTVPTADSRGFDGWHFVLRK